MSKCNTPTVPSECNRVIVPIPKLKIISIYCQSILIGLCVLLKWLVLYCWKYLISQTTKITNNRIGFRLNRNKLINGPKLTESELHNKSPTCLIDNLFGQHYYVKLKTAKLHYVESGQKSNPLIILLHGFPDCWLGWHNQINELSNFYRVCAIDLKGFNDSEKSSNRKDYHPQQICDEISEFIRTMGYEVATIVGHDLGALIGWYFAHTYPDQIDKFVAVSAPHPNFFLKNITTCPGRFTEKAIINGIWLKLFQIPYLPECELQSSKFLTKSLSHLYDTSRKFIKTSRSSVDRSSLMYTYRYLFNRNSDWSGPINYYRNFPFYTIADGGLIECPCLIITGNDDNVCRLEYIVKSSEYCENFTVKIIDGAKHWPHQEQPSEFNAVILKFLIGSRAANWEVGANETEQLSLIGRVFGVFSSSVKYGGLVFDSVQGKSNSWILKDAVPRINTYF